MAQEGVGSENFLKRTRIYGTAVQWYTYLAFLCGFSVIVEVIRRASNPFGFVGEQQKSAPRARQRHLPMSFPAPEHQVPMIRHQAVSQNAHGDKIQALFHDTEKVFKMRSFSEQPRAEVRAVQRMINHPANIHSPRSAHNRILSLIPRKYNGS
jgi:hypothetical protein